MDSCSHMIEIKKFMDKCLVCDIQVQDVSISAPGFTVKTNKWLHMEDWIEFDAAIERLLSPFRESENLDGFEADNFHLGGAIRVDCRKVRISRSHKRILGNEKVYLPVALEIHVKKVNIEELMGQLELFEDKLRHLAQNTNGFSREKDNKQEQLESIREYDPTSNSVGMEQVSSEYVPYKASVKTSTDISANDTSGSIIGEPYSPKPVLAIESSPDQVAESPKEIPLYKPGRKLQTKYEGVKEENAENEVMEKLPSKRLLHRRRSPEAAPSTTCKEPTSSPRHTLKRHPSKHLKTTNAELFGSDDSDLASPVPHSHPPAESPKRVATPLRTPSTHDRLHQEMKRKRLKLRHESALKSPLDGWLSKGSIKEKEKEKTKSVKKSSRHLTVAEPKSDTLKKTSEELTERQKRVELQQIKQLSALRDTIKAKRKSPPPVMEMLNLTHLSSEDILGTFDGIKPTLDKIFKKYSTKTKVTGFDGINHMKTLMLIDDKKQIQMMNFLRENYQPEEKGVPSLTDLYINALVPEWTINVFMKEFNFTRTEAIERLQAQEDSSVHHNNDCLDSSGPL